MEPSAPSPSVFHNGEGPLSPDNTVHSYISHMLFEDNIDDQILCQNYDHPALLQMQQALAHILSSPSSTAKNNTTNNGNSEGTEGLLHGSSGDPTSVSLGFDMGADVVGLLQMQEHRLNMCASEFGMPFTFRAITMKREEVSIENLNIDEDEVLVVNDIFNFSSLVGDSKSFDDLSPRDTVLNNIRKMKPNIFIQSVLNCRHGTSFLSRFREALFFYSALFDMLDAVVPRDSEQRLVLELGMLGRWALNAIACDGVDLIERPEKYRRWQVRNRRAGLRQLPLEPGIVKELKDMVKKHHHKNFLLSEDDQWLVQGWKGCILFAHSTWVANGASSE